MSSHSYNTNRKHSSALYKRAKEVMTGGVSRNTIFRRPHPFYVATAKGSYVTDIDANTRVDFANNMASLIHGHAHPAIIDAVNEQMHRGTAYTLGSEVEVAFGELLVERNHNFEKIRFVNSGTEAVMSMIKAARAYTGRPKIAKAEGAYHGTYDFAEISQIVKPDNWGDIDKPNSVPVTMGTPENVKSDVIIFPYNDTERTLKLLEANKKDLACVLIDPISHRVGMFPIEEDYLIAIYNWTRKNKLLLVFDEVVTYRVTYSGAQHLYPVKPDMTALGKIIGGGFPVGAIAGDAKVMSVFDPTRKIIKQPHSGTFSANPITMTAGKVAMELFDRKAVDDINNMADIAKKQIEEAIKEADVPVLITGAGSMFRMHFRYQAPRNYRETYQCPEERKLIVDFLDYLFLHEDIIMINTFACMLATTITQKEVDILTESLLKGFKIFKAEIHSFAK
ncbi:aminotransferase class III-fold pyridoxal phosphate-dependent enzyme [Lentimicrobium sp. L6]|uniref:aspartate aminotransferase family protein n=1 Tax=Lentimicrobium sp. L6 TaxID=2735916 RepID=UPI001552D736|nr:aminotransferase class III-fold pyridoxal phosphate-dependent enzyme [Lentimicrobium sp. L6]NPD84179.1 aminotransferase class III-fold pyridoxal phosphate-dependent enzyme [Lentimicrobium sp. L6]